MSRRTNAKGQFVRVPPEDRFWENVDTSGGPDACWPWTGPRREGGHGYTTDYWKKIYAHRLSYELNVGPIPDGRYICHRCDNPPCVNPAHLYAGTALDNSRDAVERGRTSHAGAANPPRGEAQHLARLTEADVRAIRKAHADYRADPPKRRRGVTHPGSLDGLAASYGVGKNTIASVVKRRTWKHVD